MKWQTIHIGGQKWSVHLVGRRSKYLEPDADGARPDGQTHESRCAIYIAKDTNEQAREDTLLHEILHATLWVSGAWAEFKGEGDERNAAEERAVKALTPVLHRLLKDLGFVFPKAP